MRTVPKLLQHVDAAANPAALQSRRQAVVDACTAVTGHARNAAKKAIDQSAAPTVRRHPAGHASPGAGPGRGGAAGRLLQHADCTAAQGTGCVGHATAHAALICPAAGGLPRRESIIDISALLSSESYLLTRRDPKSSPQPSKAAASKQFDDCYALYNKSLTTFGRRVCC